MSNDVPKTTVPLWKDQPITPGWWWLQFSDGPGRVIGTAPSGIVGAISQLPRTTPITLCLARASYRKEWQNV